jgi:hypothetical protein
LILGFFAIPNIEEAPSQRKEISKREQTSNLSLRLYLFLKYCHARMVAVRSSVFRGAKYMDAEWQKLGASASNSLPFLTHPCISLVSPKATIPLTT